MTVSRYLLFAVVILLFGYWIRVHNLNAEPMWIDEEFTWKTIYVSQHGEGFIEGMRARIAHMPLYFASMLLYPGDHSIFSMRYPSVLFGMLTIAMTMRLMTHLYSEPKWALLAGLLLAMNGMFILYSRVARMYPLGNFLIASVSYLYLRYLTQSGYAYGQRLLAYGATFLAYMTHFVTLILIPAQGLVKLRQLRQRQISWLEVFQWMMLHLILVIPLLIWVALIFDRDVPVLGWVDPVNLERVLFVAQTLFLGVFEVETIPFWWIAVPIFIIPLMVYGIRFRRIPHGDYWLGLTLLPVVVLLLFTPIKTIFHERYLSIALFAYVMVVVLGFKSLNDILEGKVYRRYVVTVVIGLYLAGMAFLTVLQMPNGHFIITI